jgi:hypothetical protein
MSGILKQAAMKVFSPLFLHSYHKLKNSKLLFHAIIKGKVLALLQRVEKFIRESSFRQQLMFFKNNFL